MGAELVRDTGIEPVTSTVSTMRRHAFYLRKHDSGR